MVALVIFTTHFQMAYFLFGAVGLFAIFRAVQERLPTRFATFLLASLLGAAGAGVQLFPAADYVTEYSRRIQTTREEAGETGRAWSSSWSMHPEEAMSMVIPEFAGNNARGPAWTSNTYWGRNAFKDNHEYAGLVVLLLAAISFAGAARKGLRWFFTGLGAVAFLFALGAHTPVWSLFYALVPGVRLFRAPSQAMFLFGFAAITLAALGLDRVFRAAREDDDEAWTPILRTLWIGAGGLALLALLAASGTLTSLWTSVLYTDVSPGKLGTLQTLLPFIGRGAWVAALLAGATAATVWALRSRYLAPSGLVAILVLLAAVDGLRVSSAFVQTLDFQRWARPGPNIQTVLQRQADDPEPYRLLSFTQRGQDVKPALHGIELAAGHHPNDLSRYRELIGMVGSGLPENLVNPNIRRLLNVRYIVWPDFQLGPAPQGKVLSRSQLSDGTVYETLLAGNGLPRARLVGSAVVKSDAEAVEYMLSPDFDPAAEVVLPEEPPLALPGAPVQGTVTWEQRTPNRLRLSVRTGTPALLVVADNWFPAWRVTVDGAEQPLLRAYHTLRAVPVPAGEHTVEMVYDSGVVRGSLWASVVVLLVLAGLGGFDLWRRRRGGGGEGAGVAEGDDGPVRPARVGEEVS